MRSSIFTAAITRRYYPLNTHDVVCTVTRPERLCHSSQWPSSADWSKSFSENGVRPISGAKDQCGNTPHTRPMISDKLGPHPWKLVHLGSRRRPFPPENKCQRTQRRAWNGWVQPRVLRICKDLQIAWYSSSKGAAVSTHSCTFPHRNSVFAVAPSISWKILESMQVYPFLSIYTYVSGYDCHQLAATETLL